MIAKTARNAAVTALLKTNESEGYSNIVIDKTLAEFALDARDSSLASALFYGVLERRDYLDYMLSQFSKRPVKKMDPAVREILRCAAYQIFFLDKIPESAAVNEAVRAAKQFAGQKTAGFVNGILRALLRGKDTVALPKEEESRRCLLQGCPLPLYRFWKAAYGPARSAVLSACLAERPPVYLRANLVKISTEALIRQLCREGVAAEAEPRLPGAVRVQKPGKLADLLSFREGLFHVQDLSSQAACAVLAPTPGSTVVDVCAAPGGKSFTLAEIMENRGKVLAFDLYKGKVGLIRSGAARLELSCVEAAVRDAEKADAGSLCGEFVLCDAPCSGLGILRRKPEIRYKDLRTLSGLPDLQFAILENTAKLVMPGGRLLYSTCTLNPAENGKVADRFLAEHPEFEPEPVLLPAFSRGMQEPENQFTFFPPETGTDGFFLALFRRRNESRNGQNFD